MDSTLKIAEDMIRLRFSQLLVNEEYKAGKFKVPIHLALGHEAIAVALSHVMLDADKLLLSHRNIAYNLAREGSLKPILDEYYLKPTGLAGGRFGSMNMLNPAKGVVYTSSILGNQFSVAVGVALGEMLFQSPGVVVVLAGDGSMEEGAFFESLVMAHYLKTPVIFLVENNEWSMATKIDECRNPIHLAPFAKSLGVRFETLRGNDPFAYRDQLQEIKTWCLTEQMPVCLEVIVTTLGDWRGPKSTEFPEGKFINYHAGPTPSVSISDSPILKNTDEDPLFVLSQKIPADDFRHLAKQQYEATRNVLA